MPQDSPPDERRVRVQNLNWFGASVYFGAKALRFAANMIDATADRASKVAAESKRAFTREVNPNIEEAQVVDEYRTGET